MIWVTWRQHRVQLVATAAVLALIALLLVPSGLSVRRTLTSDGFAACLRDKTAPGCGQRIFDFWSDFENTQNLVGFFNLLPILIGAFFGAPLLAREYEQGTWRLAWTQSVTRTRWLTTKLVLVGATVIAAGALFTAVFTWWRSPIDRLQTRFEPAAFNFEGIVPIAFCVFAFAVGAFAGAIARRTLLAMGLAVAGFLAVRLPLEFLIRPHYRTPLTRHLASGELASNVSTSLDWIVSATSQSQRYHPAERFWTFQLTEAAIYAVLSAVLIGATIWHVRRRTS